MKIGILGAICLAVLCVILTLGLWPFHAPRNAVTWIGDSDGLAFGRYATVWSEGSFDLTPRESAGWSAELRVHAEPWHYSTLLSFFDPGNHDRFELRQSITDLEVDMGNRRLYVDDVLRHKPVFVTVTSGNRGTSVYINGVLAKSAPQLHVPVKALRGRLIVGDAPREPDSFRGRIRGLAIYGSELTAGQVSQHYATWTSSGKPAMAGDECRVALYLFNERGGRIVHNAIRPGIDLIIPETYAVVDKWVLHAFWNEFEMSRSYWSAVLKNIVGFVPVGFWFFPFLAACKVRRAALWTVVAGFSISVTIEVLQAFLPTRDSGTTDMITNTLGTWLGVACYQAVVPIVQRWFPSL